MRNNKKITYRNLIILIVTIVLLIIAGIAITMARYTSSGSTDINADIAFYVVKEGFQTGNIMLSNLYPREDPFEYSFTIANTDGINVAETSIDYEVYLNFTTNLPLEVDVYKNNNANPLTAEEDIENNIVLDQSAQCYIRKIKLKKGAFTYSQAQTDTYKLKVTFPIEYNVNEAYEGVIDNVSISVNAQQKIDFQSIKASKVANIIWEDEGNRTSVRPSIVELTLVQDGVETTTKLTATAANNWEVEFTNLQKYAEDGHEIIYTVKETQVAYYKEPIYSTDGLAVTNILDIITIPTQKIVNVVWEDNNNQEGVRPASLEFILVKDGVDTATTLTVTAANGWSGRLNGLQKYTEEGREIVYTIRQKQTAPNYKEPTYSADTLTITNQIDYTALNTQKIANVIWADNNNQEGLRPESVELTLVQDGIGTETKLTADADNGWTVTFTGLQKYNADGTEIVYTVTMPQVTYYKIPEYSGNGLIVTNTLDYTSITTDKTVDVAWGDNSNQAGVRPAEVELTLVKDGTQTPTKLTASAIGGWTVTFTGLQKYKADGTEIIYTVTQPQITHYKTPTYVSTATGVTVRNIIDYSTITTEMDVEVTWTAYGEVNELEFRPSEVQLTLVQDGVETATKLTANSDNGWIVTFTGLQKYNANGTQIVYTVIQPQVSDYNEPTYTTTVTGIKVLNTLAHYYEQ